MQGHSSSQNARQAVVSEVMTDGVQCEMQLTSFFLFLTLGIFPSFIFLGFFFFCCLRESSEKKLSRGARGTALRSPSSSSSRRRKQKHHQIRNIKLCTVLLSVCRLQFNGQQSCNAESISPIKNSYFDYQWITLVTISSKHVKYLLVPELSVFSLFLIIDEEFGDFWKKKLFFLFYRLNNQSILKINSRVNDNVYHCYLQAYHTVLCVLLFNISLKKQ